MEPLQVLLLLVLLVLFVANVFLAIVIAETRRELLHIRESNERLRRTLQILEASVDRFHERFPGWA